MNFTPQNGPILETAMAATQARVGVGRVGTRPSTATFLKFRCDHALAKDAVGGELSEEFLKGFAADQSFPVIESLASSREDYVLFPPKGKRTTNSAIESLKKICPADQDIQIVISDGLSARAVEENVADLLPMLKHGFELHKWTYGLPVVVRRARVAIADQIAEALNAKLVINLIGERPGLSCADSLSAYITYSPGVKTISSDRTVVSNIHPRGTPAIEAGAYIVKLIEQIFQHQVSGVGLQQLS
jgi:ethanolamine ammonia-lyase small subunit